MCLLTIERYKTYQTGFSFRRLGHAPGVGLGGTEGCWGAQKLFPKFIQIWCVSYLHEWHMQLQNFLGPRLLGPWGGAKRSNIIKGIIHTFFQMRLLYSLQYGRNNSPLNTIQYNTKFYWQLNILPCLWPTKYSSGNFFSPKGVMCILTPLRPQNGSRKS